MKPFCEMVDFHSHILPGVDHGSDSLQTTLFQLKSAHKNGVCKIISTSHFYPTAHNVDTFIKKRDEAFETIKPFIKEPMEIKLGAEVLLCSGIENLAGIEKLFISGTKTLLLELPLLNFDDSYRVAVKKLLEKGINVVIAHAERYSHETIELLLSLGVKLQLNSSVVCRFRGRRNARIWEWINSGAVVAIGSDIHGKDDRAYRKFAKASSKVSKRTLAVLNESCKIWENAK